MSVLLQNLLMAAMTEGDLDEQAVLAVRASAAKAMRTKGVNFILGCWMRRLENLETWNACAIGYYLRVCVF